MVTEAGGKVSDLNGEDHALAGQSILAANLDLHPQLLEKLQAV